MIFSSFDFELVHENSSNKAVLLFHGMTGTPFEMKKYASFLFKNGFDVYCYCLPGHGNHPVSIYCVSWKDWIEFSKEKFSEHRSKYDYFFLGGLCLGAVISLNLCEIYNNISGIICLSTTLFLDGWTIPKYNFLMPIGLYTILRYYYTFPEREPFGIKNENYRRIIQKLTSKNNVALDHYPMNAIYELLRLSKYTRKYLDKITSPVLLIHSKHDDLTSIKSAELVFNRISSRKKKMVILKDSYHLIIHDNERENVFKESVEFLNNCIHKKVEALL